MPYRFVVILASLLLPLANPALAQTQNLFPRPPELEQAIHFWTQVYTEIDNDHGFIHDRNHLNVIYEVITLPNTLDRQATKEQIQSREQHYQTILLQLTTGKHKNLTKEERRVLALWPRNISDEKLQAAATRIRFQRGQSNRFRKGLIRAGTYTPFILKTLDSLNLPQELAVLPHVESSFNPTARSHAGAVGLWQFTRPTGLRFLHINRLVDERLDPFKATVAAARLLKHNYEITGTWPLAITAYNHGLSGMQRAEKQLGTSDIVAIRQHYQSPTFGFASRNFYVAFLAALEVNAKAKYYFGPFQPDKPQKSEVIMLSSFVPIKALERALGLNKTTLRKSNPALLPTIWKGKKYVPQGYQLRVPCLPSCRGGTMIARLAPWERFYKQAPDRFHLVQRGQTLSRIAQHYGIKVQKLAKLNKLSDPSHIRIGQRLRLPLPAIGHYTVQRGDTLSKIARRFNIALQTLLEVNEITDKHQIYVGQHLQLAQFSSSSETSKNR